MIEGDVDSQMKPGVILRGLLEGFAGGLVRFPLYLVVRPCPGPKIERHLLSPNMSIALQYSSSEFQGRRM